MSLPINKWLEGGGVSDLKYYHLSLIGVAWVDFDDDPDKDYDDGVGNIEIGKEEKVVQ